MRFSPVIVLVFASAGGCLFAALASCSLDKATNAGPAPHPGDGAIDGLVDVSSDGSLPDATPGEGGDFDGPPPIEDTAIEDFGTMRPPGEHIEATIGPSGGTLSGLDGTPLVHVSLVVPAGALVSPTLFAIDLDRSPPAAPSGAVMVTPYVHVGPDATSFAIPARLTLPYATTATTPLLVMLGRAGVAWSSLLDPHGDVSAVTLSADLSRASPAAGFLVTATTPPKPTDFSPDHAAIGDLVFVEGTSFGIAPTWSPAGDGGADSTSTVLLGALVATPLAWSDTAISFRVPAGSTGGVITVNGAAGSGATATALIVP